MGLALAVVGAGAVALLVVGYLGMAGKLPRNHFAGMRTRGTMRSDEAWIAAHRAAGAYLVLGAAAALAIALAIAPFAIAGVVSDGLAVGALIAAIVIILVSTLVAGLMAVRAAGRVEQPTSPD